MLEKVDDAKKKHDRKQARRRMRKKGFVEIMEIVEINGKMSKEKIEEIVEQNKKAKKHNDDAEKDNKLVWEKVQWKYERILNAHSHDVIDLTPYNAVRFIRHEPDKII